MQQRETYDVFTKTTKGFSVFRQVSYRGELVKIYHQHIEATEKRGSGKRCTK